MNDIMKQAFEEALKRQKDKRMKIEIKFGGDDDGMHGNMDEKEEEKSDELAPDVKDASMPMEKEEGEGMDMASMLESLIGEPSKQGREPKGLQEKAVAKMKMDLQKLKS